MFKRIAVAVVSVSLVLPFLQVAGVAGANATGRTAATKFSALSLTEKAIVFKCQSPKKILFDNGNIYGVSNGGKQPSFSTKGIAYCLIQITTYHWNDGRGAIPGTISLVSSTGLKIGPRKAIASAGQGNAPNVYWKVDSSAKAKPTIINGIYKCVDSNPSTWSQDSQSNGFGFCQVVVEKAVKA
jgi:hypothetical protein